MPLTCVLHPDPNKGTFLWVLTFFQLHVCLVEPTPSALHPRDPLRDMPWFPLLGPVNITNPLFAYASLGVIATALLE